MNDNYLGIHINGSVYDFKLKGKTLFSLNIPSNVQNDMEIVDPLGFEKLLTEAIKMNKLEAQKTNIFLSNEVIFNKIITSPEDEKKFFDQIPLEPQNIIKETIPSGNQKIAIAVNKKYIDNVKSIFEKIGFKVASIVPEAESIRKLIDFNNELKTPPDGGEKKPMPSSLKISLIALAVVAIIVAILFFFIKKPLIKIEIVNQSLATPEATSSSTPTSTPSAFLTKNEINMKVLNKTKTAGLAQKVKDALPSYPNIETGNSSKDNALTTDVTFTPKIGESEKNEIYDLLIGMFSSVASTSGDLTDGFDILIEVGNPS